MGPPKLKRCPFCGSNRAGLLERFQPEPLYRVQCRGCNASTAESMTQTVAISRWNTRPVSLDVVAQDALDEYNAAFAAGGELPYPQWAADHLAGKQRPASAPAERALEPQGQALPVAEVFHYEGITYADLREPITVKPGDLLYASQLALPAGPVPELKRIHAAMTNCEMYGEDGEAKGVMVPKSLLDQFERALPAVAQPVADERDAARLDWIDEQRSDFNHGVVLGMHFIKGKSGQQFHGKTLRAAIDAALSSLEVIGKGEKG